MIDITIRDLQKHFGENHVLKGLSCEIFAGEKVGLLGCNGAGKTTLFKILAGSETYESGQVNISGGGKAGVLDQIPVYPSGFKVVDVLRTAFDNLVRLRDEMTKLEAEMALRPDAILLKRYGAFQTQFETLGGYTMESEIARVCNGLRIDEAMQVREFCLLSGGEKTRVNLARIMLMHTDILLLDEPTNHLDIKSVEWLEAFLRQYKGIVIAISHDRYFLDAVVTRIIEIVDGQAELYAGSYSYYVEEKEARYQQCLNQYESEQKKIKQLEEAAKRMHEWARNADNAKMHRQAFAIEKRIERMDKTDRPVKQQSITKEFQENGLSGKEVLILAEVAKSYDHPVIAPTSLTIRRGERLALLGDSGCGKTTLLRIITGEVVPDSGLARIGGSVQYALLPQIVTFDQPDATVLETVRYALEIGEDVARKKLAGFHFRGPDVFKRVRSLSGGERSRLRLCLLMQEAVNLLILDEPTNHLDIASREWIETALDEFQGTILFVSHDRYFIRRFATRIWELDHGNIRDFRGTYDEYRQEQSRLREITPPIQETPKKIAKTPPPSSRQKAGVTRKSQEAQELEQRILKLEEELRMVETQMEKAASDHVRINALYEERSTLASQIDSLYSDWMNLG